jgi:hypothetical protein
MTKKVLDWARNLQNIVAALLYSVNLIRYFRACSLYCDNGLVKTDSEDSCQIKARHEATNV